MKKLIISLLLLATVLGVDAAPKLISIETKAKGLYLLIEDSGRVSQSHFGDKLLSSDDLIAGYSSLAASKLRDAYPTVGTVQIGEPALKLTHSDGNMTTQLEYVEHKSTVELDGAMIKSEILLRDNHYPLDVKLIYKAYQQENIITSAVEITNREKGKIAIDCQMSSAIAIEAESYHLTRYYGSWASEMQLVEGELKDGITVIDNKAGVRTSQDGAPTFILSLNNPASETEGEVIIGSLAWSGNYKFSFEVDNAQRLYILSGMNDYLSRYNLSPKQSLATPEMVLAHSSNGVGEASRNLHRWVRRYNIQDGDQERPIVLNSWEGVHFDIEESSICDMIADAAGMGVEIFVLDDGWFGMKHPRNKADAGLGDWVVNTDKLPNGLQALIDKCHECGIRFGLWVEPEMVNPRSELAERHPDWIVSSPNREPLLERNQLLLDLSNPKVQDFVYNAVATILKEHPDVAYIKWDANRLVQEIGSSYQAKMEQSHFWHDYTKGLYSVYEKLSNDFPDVIFQACASGGGRIDYGSIKYHHEVWGSDNTDAEKRLFINWGISQYMPSIALASHVSHSPNRQTRVGSSIKFRFDLSMSERLGIELLPAKLTPAELDWTRRAVAEYKKIRPIVQFGDLYRLNSPYSDDDFAALSYVGEDLNKAVIFAYSIDYHHKDEYLIVKAQGLDPQKRYTIREILPVEVGGKPRYTTSLNGKTLSGDFLMKVGIDTKLKYRHDSALFELVAE
ncbi:MAG: alpha-galactosidase [Rikenellaceae bacterium]